MKLKKSMIAIASCLFVTMNAYSSPNTVIVNGKIFNTATKDISPSGWNFINTRIFLSKPSDASNVKVDGKSLPTNGLYFELYPEPFVEYVIDTTHLTGSLTIHTFDPNCNTTCEWQYYPGQIAPKLTLGSGSFCSNSYNDLYMGKACLSALKK